MKISLLATIAIACFAGACTTNIPTEQVKVFSTAFQSANEAGQPLLDDLAAAEREQGKVNAARRAEGSVEADAAAGPASCPPKETNWRITAPGQGFMQGYCVADAAYFASLGDPPATRVFRGGLAVLGKYVDVLTLLAEGRNLDELHGQLESLRGDITGLLALVPTVGAFAPAIGGALSALKPIIDDAAKQANAVEIRRLVTSASPNAKDLIEQLKAATPWIFNNLTAMSAEKATSRQARDNPDMAKAEIEHIEAYRATVSNFVVLLDGLEIALDKLVIAVQNPDQSASLQTLAEESAKLHSYADAVRAAFAALRRGS